MDEYTTMLCAAVLVIAGLLELLANPTKPRLLRYSGILAGIGFLLLGARYIHLIVNADTSRLHIYGTASIGAIALGRIIACASVLRKGLP